MWFLKQLFKYTPYRYDNIIIISMFQPKDLQRDLNSVFEVLCFNPNSWEGETYKLLLIMDYGYESIL